MANKDTEKSGLLFVFEPDSQTEIAALAVEEFEKNWHKGNGDGDEEWLRKLRLDSPGDAKAGVTPKDWATFFQLYAVNRGFHSRDKLNADDEIQNSNMNEISTTIKEHSDHSDAYKLAETWKDKKITRYLALSAASKALFFSYPNHHKNMIFDRFACLAVSKRLGRNLNNTKHDFSAFRENALKFSEKNSHLWEEEAKKLGAKNKVDMNFIVRRLADKHLLVEGKIIDAHINLNTSVHTLAQYNFLERATKAYGLRLLRE